MDLKHSHHHPHSHHHSHSHQHHHSHHSRSHSPHHHHSHHSHSHSPHHHHHHHGHHLGPMDPSIWSRLPDIILNRVLARLPLSCLLKLRLVSSSWNSNILSPTIAALRSGLFPHCPGFIRVSAHHSDAGHLQLDFLDRHFHWRKICLGVPPGSIEIESAHSHLLCLSLTFNSLDGYIFKRFLMCNPVTAACKYLPPTLVTCYPIIVGTTVERTSGDYVLLFGGNFKIAKGNQQATRTAEVYKSSTGKWNRVQDMPPHVTPVLTSVTCNGCIYWLAWDDDEHFGVLLFDPEREEWKWVRTPCDVECYVPWGLMERHGVLYKVGRVSSNPSSPAYVWELQPEMAWRVLCQVPEDSERHWRGCVRHCVGHDGALCADNSCGTGGLIYKFDAEGQISIYRTPVCPIEEQTEHEQDEPAAAAASAAIGALALDGKDESGDSEDAKDEAHDCEDGKDEAHDSEDLPSSEYSSDSSSYSSDSSSSEDKELEPDLPDTFGMACSPDMVAPFGHLYVFEPCLGKV